MPLILLILLLPCTLAAQSFRAGIVYSDIYSASFINPHRPQAQPAAGINFRLITLGAGDSLWILEYEIGYQEKGYSTHAEVEGERQQYQLNFPYFYQNFMASRQLAPQLDTYAGLGVHTLFWPTLRTPTDTISMRDTYSPVDVNLLAGFRIFPASRLSIDVRASGSMLPILRYEAFDNFGNSEGSRRGIRHLTLEATLMLNLYKNRKTLFR